MGPEELEAALLGAPCDLTRAEVGIPEEQARGFWTATGFAEVPAGERAFTRLDVAALRHALELTRLRRRSVRGYRSLTPHLLRRAGVAS